jgi:uncharacterized protein
LSESGGIVARQSARIRADLRWLLLSPNLLDDRVAEHYSRPGDVLAIQHFSDSERVAIEDWLAGFEIPAELLAVRANAGQQRLGRYAERLLGFYLKEGPLHRSLATHLALRSAGNSGQTLGEIDALLTDSAGDHWHWELAVKFFLCTSHSLIADATEFVGPNRRDSLANKIDKLMGRQLRQTPPAPWDEIHWRRAAFVRGMIFYRYGYPIVRCDALSPEHCRGWWLPADSLAELADEAYAPVPRLRWMVPTPLSNPALVLEGRRAVTAYMEQRRAEQYQAAQYQAAIAPRGSNAESAEMLVRLRWIEGIWQEQDRGFVVFWN